MAPVAWFLARKSSETWTHLNVSENGPIYISFWRVDGENDAPRH
jgi:hypothetical protein